MPTVDEESKWWQNYQSGQAERKRKDKRLVDAMFSSKECLKRAQREDPVIIAVRSRCRQSSSGRPDRGDGRDSICRRAAGPRRIESEEDSRRCEEYSQRNERCEEYSQENENENDEVNAGGGECDGWRRSGRSHYVGAQLREECDGVVYLAVGDRAEAGATGISRLLPYIPKACQAAFVRYFHGDAEGGAMHFGINKTVKLLRKRAFWYGMNSTVRSVINTCEACQRQKSLKKPAGFICRELFKAGPWHTVGIDFYGPLPKSSRGYRYVLVFVDHFSKWPEAYPCKDTSVSSVVKWFYPLVLRYGCPVNILTDNGSSFICSVFRELCNKLKIGKLTTTPYRPQSNGIAEAFMKVLGTQLAVLADPRHSNWADILPAVLFAYRSLPHPSTGESPFFLMHGYDPAWPSDVAMEKAVSPGNTFDWNMSKEIPARIRQMQRARLGAWYQLKELYEKLRKRNENEVKLTKYRVNQLVMVELNPYEKGLYASRKLAPNWIGPCRVLEACANQLTYKVRDILTGRIRQVHIGQTKPFRPMAAKEVFDMYAKLAVLPKTHGELSS